MNFSTILKVLAVGSLLTFFFVPMPAFADFASCKADAADDGVTDTFTPTIGGLIPATSDTGIPINMPPSPPTPGWVYSLDQAFAPFSQIANGYLPYTAGLGSHTYSADGCYKFTVYSDGFGSVFKAAVFVGSGTPDWGGVAPDTNTRIETVTPLDNSVIATSSSATIAATGYVNPSDFATSSTKLVITLDNGGLSSSQVACVYCSFLQKQPSALKWEISLSSSGDFSFSSSTPLLILGDYDMTVSIVVPKYTILGFDFFQRTLVSTTTLFTVSTTTSFDRLRRGVRSDIDSFLNGTTTTEYSASLCNVLSSNFQIYGCFHYLIIPSQGDLVDLGKATYDSILSIFPLGYVTRFVAILSLTDSAEPPALSYTFGSSSPSTLQGKTYTMQIFDQFDTLTSIRTDDGENKNVWDIVMPYFQTVVAFAVLFVILSDLLGVQLESDSTQWRNVEHLKDDKGNDVTTRTTVKDVHGSITFDNITVGKHYQDMSKSKTKK